VTRRRPRPSVTTADAPRDVAAEVRPPWGVLSAVAALALGLRIWHLTEGLPDFFEEAFPFRRAFDMAGWERGRVDWDPHAFHYPSLTFYLHLALQWIHCAFGRLAGWFRSPADYYVAFQTDPTSMAVLARLVSVAADLAVVVMVAFIGERLRRGAGLLAALLVALSATLVRDTHAIYTDPVMAGLAIAALERMMTHRDRGDRGSLMSAAVLSGLAAGAKYPALLLAIPLAWTTLSAAGRAPRAWGSRLGRLALALLTAAVVFVATSPFLFVDLAKARFDLMRIASQVGEGQLGTFGHPTAAFYVESFIRDFGWIAPVLLAISLLALWPRPRPATAWAGACMAPWLFLVAFIAPVLIGRVEFERYMVPVIPAAALLIAFAALELPEAWPHAGVPLRVTLRAFLVLAVAAPAAWAGFHAAALGGDTTQGRARRFLEAQVPTDQLVIQEAHAAPLLDRWDAERIERSPAFRAASPAWRARFERRVVLRAPRLPLLVAGRASVVAPMPHGAPLEIPLFASSADLNRVFYEPALYDGVDWMVTSDAVRGRYLQDSTRYAAQSRLYRLLDEHAEHAAVFRSGGTVTGPEIRVYRLTASTHRALVAGGVLDSLWWTRDIPADARGKLTELMAGYGAARGSARVPSWVTALGGLFDQQIEPFVYRLALELADLGRCDPATRLADAILLVTPAHLQATGLVVSCAESRGEWMRARDAIEALLAARDSTGSALLDIRLEYAALLAQTGARDAARDQLERVLASPGFAETTRAREMLRRLERASHP